MTRPGGYEGRKENNMLALREIRGKKANQVRWETLKLLDWEKDAAVIQKVMEVTNPLFFSSRTPEDCVAYVREQIAFDEKLRAAKEA